MLETATFIAFVVSVISGVILLATVAYEVLLVRDISGYITWTLAAILMLSLTAVTVLTAISSSRKMDDFMTECAKEHKRYECEFMWRASSK